MDTRWQVPGHQLCMVSRLSSKIEKWSVAGGPSTISISEHPDGTRHLLLRTGGFQ
jgi:hypothetical protein